MLEDADNSAEDALTKAGPPQVLVEVPGEASRSIPLEETAPGHYEASIPAGEKGLYRIVSGSRGNLCLPEQGFYRDAEETKPQAVNVALLSEISRVTGGRMHPSIDQVLTDKGTLVRARSSLWPYWLILALVLNFLEVALRKGFFERMKMWWNKRSLQGLRRQPA